MFARFLHETSHDANTAQFNCSNFRAQWLKAMELAKQLNTQENDHDIQQDASDLGVEDLKYELAK